MSKKQLDVVAAKLGIEQVEPVKMDARAIVNRHSAIIAKIVHDSCVCKAAKNKFTDYEKELQKFVTEVNNA